MSNLPDDWGRFYRVCDACGKRYHLSGAESCDCEHCSECGEMYPPDEFTHDQDVEICDDCWEREDHKPDKWDLADQAYAEWKDNPEDRKR